MGLAAYAIKEIVDELNMWGCIGAAD